MSSSLASRPEIRYAMLNDWNCETFPLLTCRDKPIKAVKNKPRTFIMWCSRDHESVATIEPSRFFVFFCCL